MKASKIFLPLVLSFVLIGGTAIAGPAGTPPAPVAAGPDFGPDFGCDGPMPAGGPHHGCPEMGHPRPPHFLKALSPEDRAKYKEMMEEFTLKSDTLKDEMFVKLSQLKALQHSSTPDLKAVTETAQQVVAIRVQLRSLKKEQHQKSKAFIQDHMPKRPAGK